MREKNLNLLGLMRRANAIAIGETNTGTAVKSGKTKLLLIASDASDNARRRAESFVAGRNVPIVQLPFTKEEVSSHVGVSGCSMAAVLDLGFAEALMKLLAAEDPSAFAAVAQELAQKNAKAQKRKKEAAAQERNKRIGKRRNSV